MIDLYVWSIDILERSNLESKNEVHVDEHQSYILEEPQDPCLCWYKLMHMSVGQALLWWRASWSLLEPFHVDLAAEFHDFL